MSEWQLPHTVPRRTTVEIQTPGGLVVGPEEPSEQMQMAALADFVMCMLHASGGENDVKNSALDRYRREVAAVYRAMLAASGD